MADVLVVGGGLSGALSALGLAKQGFKVALSQRGYGATQTFAGPLELAVSPAVTGAGRVGQGVTPHAMQRALGWSLRQHIEDMQAHHPTHPFSVMGTEKTLTHMRAGLGLLEEVVGAHQQTLRPWGAESPCIMWPATNGTMRLGATRIQAKAIQGVLPWRCATERDVPPKKAWGVVDLANLGAPLGPRALAGWRFDAAKLGAEGRGPSRLISIQGPEASILDVSPSGPDGRATSEHASSALMLARHLDDLQTAQLVAKAISERLPKDLEGVITPPVLGLLKHAQVIEMWQKILGVAVHEASAVLPSVPAVRLMQMLQAALSAHGVQQVGGVDHLVRDGSIVREARLDDGQSLHAAVYVLGTGRFLGGGFHWPQGGVATNALLSLPLFGAHGFLSEKSAMELTRRRPEEAHPLLSAGVMTDHDLRPVDHQGTALENVFATGLMLFGLVPRDERSSDGVALATSQHVVDSVARKLGAQGILPDASPQAHRHGGV